MIWLVLSLWGCELGTMVNNSPGSTVDSILHSMREQPIEYTRHGRCRMVCRQVSVAEVDEILHVGTVVVSRTRTDGDCPTYAVEGTTSEEQHVRIVYAACATKTKVVTAIDLGKDWPCGEC